MAVRIPSPYYTRGGGIASGGGSLTPPAPVDPNQGMIGGLANLFNTVIGRATYDPETDPRAQAARKYRLEGDALETTAAGQNSIAKLFGGVDLSNPDSVRDTVQRMAGAAASAGIKPQQIADLFRFFVTNTPGTTNDQVTRGVVGAGGAALGENQSYTVAGQEAIRRDNERMAGDKLRIEEAGLDRRNTADNVASGERNDATIAGAMSRAEMEEAGRMARRYDAPVNAAPGTTTYFGPGDPRNSTGERAPTTPGRPLSLAQLAAERLQAGDRAGAQEAADLTRRSGNGAPLDLSPTDSANIGFAVDDVFTRAGVEDVPPDLRSKIINRASELYQQTRNSTAAVDQAIKEMGTLTAAEGGWFGAAGSYAPREPAAATGAPAGSGSGVAVGATATNPQTGAKVQWDGKAWVPVR